MTIEQVLMRSLKTSGGLTRGRGISPSTIAKWVHSMPAASRVIDAMETFSGVACVTSEQHVDLRDHADTATFLTWLDLHHPFQRASPLLASLASGVVVSAAVNCDDALSVGEASMKAMEGNPPAEKEQCPVLGKCDEGGESTQRGRLHQSKPVVSSDSLHREKRRGACRVLNIRVGSMPPGTFR